MKLRLMGIFSEIDGVTIINNYGNEWNRVRVVTQEFKFSNPAASDSRLQWTAGAYFFHQDNPVKQTTHFGEDAQLLGLPDNNFSLTNFNIGENTGFAFFGQASYAFTPKLKFIAGLRYDYEAKKFTVRASTRKLLILLCSKTRYNCERKL